MPMGLWFTPYDLLVVPALILALWAQYRVRSTYARYSQVGTRAGMSGAEVACRILQDSNITPTENPEAYPNNAACGLTVVPGELTDHYDPRTRVLGLSEAVYHGRSVAALGIAAHEVGHAIQHARAYAPLTARNVIYPVCNLGSMAAFPLFFLGFLLGTPMLMHLGIAFFSVAVAFTFLTLPVEFNASRRAMRALAGGGYLTGEELAGARAVLSAAALTYVAAAAMAAMQLLRMVLLARSRD